VSVALELAPVGAHLAPAQVAGRVAELTHLAEPMLNRGQAQTPVRRFAWAGPPYAQRKPHPGHAATTTCAIASGESVCGSRLANRSGHRQSGGYTRSCARARSWQTGVWRSRGRNAALAWQPARRRRRSRVCVAGHVAGLRDGQPRHQHQDSRAQMGRVEGPVAPVCVPAGARVAADAMAVHS